MTDSSNQDADAMPPDGVLLWTKKFPDGQLFQARRTMPFDMAIQTVEGVLAQIERETNGQLQCQPTKGLSQVRFTLATESGKKGLDIVVGNSTPGLLGWGYYTFPSPKELRLWTDIGNGVWKALDREMDKAAGLLLIDQQGWDAFEDTELGLRVEVDGQYIEVPILSVAVTPPSRVAQAVENLLDYYDEVAEVNRIIDEWESVHSLPAVISDQAAAITPTAAPERVTVADAMVGMTEPLRAAVNDYFNAMTAPMRETIKETIGTELRRAVGLDEESFERARDKLARQKATQEDRAIENQPPTGGGYWPIGYWPDGPSHNKPATREPKLPKRDGDNVKWYALWRQIRPWVDKGENARDIEERIQRNPKDFNRLPTGQKTIREVIKAGKAGLFDNLP